MNDDKGKGVLTAEEQLEEEEEKKRIKKALALWEKDKHQMISRLERERESRMKILNGESKRMKEVIVSKYSDIVMRELNQLMDEQDELYDILEESFGHNDEWLEQMAIKRKFAYDVLDDMRDRAFKMDKVIQLETLIKEHRKRGEESEEKSDD